MRRHAAGMVLLLILSGWTAAQPNPPVGSKENPVKILAYRASELHNVEAPFTQFAASAGLHVEFLPREFHQSPVGIPESKKPDPRKPHFVIISLHPDVFTKAQDLPAIEKGMVNWHRSIVQGGGTTVLHMCYRRSNSDGPAVQDLKKYWENLKVRLDAEEINGARHETILVPVLLLKDEGLAKWGKAFFDGHHTTLGGYSVALLFYSYLTGQDPRELKINPAASVGGRNAAPMTAEHVQWCQDKAWEYYRTHYTPKHARQVTPAQAKAPRR